MTLDFTDDQSTLVQVMAWCRQATSHYLSQCWPRCLSPYGVTRPQCISKLTTIGSDNGLCVAWSVPHHYLNWCWNIVNSNLINKLQWNLKRNSNSRIFKKMHLKMSCAHWRPFCLSLNVLMPAANLCDSSVIIFLSIKTRIWHHLCRQLHQQCLFCWLSSNLYDQGQMTKDFARRNNENYVQ